MGSPTLLAIVGFDPSKDELECLVFRALHDFRGCRRVTVVIGIARPVSRSAAQMLTHEITPAFKLFNSKTAGTKMLHGSLECVISLFKGLHEPGKQKLFIDPSSVALVSR